MENPYPKNLTRRLGPLSTAGVALASSAAASAAVVYHSAPPITSSTDFSIDASGNDFTFSFDPGTMGFMDPNPKMPIFLPGTFSSFTLTPIGGEALITTEAYNFGEVVDGNVAFTGNATSPSSGTSYYGFSLIGGETTLYGWIQMTYTPGGDFAPPGSGSIDQWAYEDSGAPIEVGQTETTAIPEPAAAGAIAALLAGSAAAWKRRRRQELVAA